MSDGPAVVAVTSLRGADGGPAAAAAMGVAIARSGGEEPRGVVVLEHDADAKRRPTLVSSRAARKLEADLGRDLPAVARGALCVATARDGLAEAIPRCLDTGTVAVVVHAPPDAWRELVDSGIASAAVLRADPRESRPLAAIAANALIAAGVPTGVLTRAPGLVATRRALAGIDPGGDLGRRTARLAQRLVWGQDGQAAPVTLFLALAVVVAGVLLAVVGSAATGASRYQRAADLAAVSAARSMRDDHARLFLPPKLPGGLPNPAHLSEAEYRGRAQAAAREALARNGAEAATEAVSFPGATFAPTRVRVALDAEVVIGGERTGADVEVVAEAEAYPVAAAPASATTATGGGYSGPLAIRQGEGMRPDVAVAFDRLANAARADGVALVINSGFRSDSEQARLFAANPDPRMVARPGTSLHRCGTELDLGPPAAYGWLAANARRFGFVQRYSWEAWHYGYTEGPAPCSAWANRTRADAGDGRGAATALPSFVPARFREPLLRSAARWGVPSNVLAAQLLAESNFNPLAVSSAGARGIAQFMPGTAAAYGLANPHDPEAAIDAQGHLMSDLMRQFDDVSLALAAYNAGPAPVAACNCIPPYPETQAYVARILGLMGGAGVTAPPALGVRLIR